MRVQPISCFAGGALLAAAIPHLARALHGGPVPGGSGRSQTRGSSAVPGVALAVAGLAILVGIDEPGAFRASAAAAGFLASPDSVARRATPRAGPAA